jgi:bacillithiol synthase
MNWIATRLPYRQTNAFTRIALDYIDQAEALKPFFLHPPSLQGLQKAISERKKTSTNRQVLVEQLRQQYVGIDTNEKVKQNIESLLSPDTFTITTAHQNNIFTGPLYFIYKILHAIKLADQLNETWPEQHFVPVYYIGSEDADLEELNHTWLNGEKLVWNCSQTGAVGRMVIDQQLISLIDRMQGELLVHPHGETIIAALRAAYQKGVTVATATFHFVNFLFGEYGLLVLQPDNAALKTQMAAVFEDDLLQQTASGIVETSATALEKAGYKVQANPREINLFYLEGDQRERIERKGENWVLVNSRKTFSKTEILKELADHPEKFSPNVILRGLYQEKILPNIAFIGGGGETAYWLQLKELFSHYQIPFPVLLLRNSFLVVEQKWKEKIARLGFTTEDLFLPEQDLLNKLVLRDSKNPTRLNGAIGDLEKLYTGFRQQAASIDTTLETHVEALKKNALFRLQELEKKMLRAEKRKFNDQQRQIQRLKEKLFPGNGLQERKENMSGYYALWGKDFIDALYKASPGLEQEFVILEAH